MKALLSLVMFALLAGTLNAQVTFCEAVGGAEMDQSIFAQATSDGGYVAVGWTTSFGAGGWDIYMVKTDASGNVLWAKTYGGPGDEIDCAVQQTFDGGYIITARSNSFGAGSADVYLIKTDSNGDIIWTKTYGGPDWDEGHNVQQTADHGYVHIGFTKSYGAGSEDAFVIKNDSDGNMQWTKTYGGSADEHGHYIQKTSDGGYIFTGETISFGAGDWDFYSIKMDATGNVQWSKTYGGTGEDIGWAVQPTSDRGYIFGGYTNSFGAGGFDFYLIKTDSLGTVLWSKTYGTPGDEHAYFVQQTTDGGYIMAGETSAVGSDSADVYIVKTDAVGTLQWSKTFGGAGDDGCQFIQQTPDLGYIIAGYTNSFGAGSWDFYLIKTDSAGNVISGDNGSSPVTIENSVPTLAADAPSIVSSGGIENTVVSSQSSGGLTTVCSTVSGIATIAYASNVTIYPNPISTSGILSISSKEKLNPNPLFVMTNVLGQEVMKIEIAEPKSEIERGNLKEGIYFYKVNNGSETIAKGKLVIADN